MGGLNGQRTTNGVVGHRRGGLARRRILVSLTLALLAAFDAARAARAQDSGAVGSVEGIVIDSKTGEPIIEAGIEVIGQNKKVKTDLDGKYSLKLPPGSYELRIFAPLYQGTRLKNVVVTANQITKGDANLKPEGEAAVETVEVVAEAKKSAEATQIVQRQKAAVVSDTISSQQFAKSPDSKASDVVRRVPAVTIKDNKFIVVRGLGERYSSALLNASHLPSTDPNRRVIPLDLFPADFIDSLNIIKSYTPDLPGDFAGGLLDIQLREFPSKLTFTLGAQMGINTETTFQNFGTYHACPGDDYFGFGSNCRDLPSVFGDTFSPSTLYPTTPQMQRLVGSLPVNWTIHHQTAPPNFTVNGSVGNTWGPFGLNIGAIYKTEYRERPNEPINSYEAGDPITGEPAEKQIFTYTQSDFETQLGAVLTSGYTLSPNHKFFGNALVNRRSIDDVLLGDGFDIQSSGPQDQRTFSSSQQYTSDQLGFGQLGGKHHWDPADVTWRAAWAPSYEDQPDNKFLQYIQPVDATRPEVSPVNPPTRTWANLHEFLQDYSSDVVTPFNTRLPFTDVWSGLPAKFKTGAAYLYRHRTFDYRTFTVTSSTNAVIPPGFLMQPPDQLFIPPNFGSPNDNYPLNFQETTSPADSFKGSQDVAAGYTMLDLPIFKDQLRFVGGVRLEYSYIKTDGFQVANSTVPANARINNLDPLPGVNLIYTPRGDMNIRYSVSQTVSRPEFRELTPTQYVVAIGQRSFQGNNQLIESKIVSNDLRWEWFFTPLELVSASFFYKDITNPIEVVALSATSSNIDTPVNADSGTLWGFEFEGRKNFGFLSDYAARVDWLKPIAGELYNVQLMSNISVVESNVTGLQNLPPGTGSVAITNTSRQLLGQAPFVVNAALEYQSTHWGIWRLLYNTVGSYIVAAGVDNLDDIKQQPRNQLDAVWLKEIAPFDLPLTAKIAVENILNDRYLQTQGDLITNRYRTGATFKFGISYTY